MTYSKELFRLAVVTYPDWSELHSAMSIGSIWAERLLCDASPSIDAIDLANAIVAATQSGAAFDLANAVLLKERVYQMCLEENKNRNTVGPNDSSWDVLFKARIISFRGFAIVRDDLEYCMEKAKGVNRTGIDPEKFADECIEELRKLKRL